MQESKHKRTDRSVLCCLRKAEAGKAWPRLTKDKTKVTFILYKKMGGKPDESADVNHFAAQVQTCNKPDVANVIAVNVKTSCKAVCSFFNQHNLKKNVSS